MENSKTAHFLYLLGVLAYLEEDGTVTEGTVKKTLPVEMRNKSSDICKELVEGQYLNLPRRNRLQFTEKGKSKLAHLAQNTDYQFKTAKGAKILNALLRCQRKIEGFYGREISFEEFSQKLESLYRQKRKTQAMSGVIAVRSEDLRKEFLESHAISGDEFDSFFLKMKQEKSLFVTIENNQQLIDWAE